MSSKLRVALAKTRELLILAQDAQVSQDMILKARKVVSEALAEPLLNYVVGTPEEQAERFKRYCPSGDCKRWVCNSYGNEKLFRHKCALIWAQMPYEPVKN